MQLQKIANMHVWNTKYFTARAKSLYAANIFRLYRREIKINYPIKENVFSKFSVTSQSSLIRINYVLRKTLIRVSNNCLDKIIINYILKYIEKIARFLHASYFDCLIINLKYMYKILSFLNL